MIKVHQLFEIYQNAKTKGLLSVIGKIPLLGPLKFYLIKHVMVHSNVFVQLWIYLKMLILNHYERYNKLPAGGKFMAETHLTDLGFTYNAWDPFTKSKKLKKTRKFRQTGDSTYVYQNVLDKHAFNMTWPKEMLKIWQEEKLLIKYYLIKHLTLLRLTNEFGLSLMVYKLFDEKSGEAINDETVEPAITRTAIAL